MPDSHEPFLDIVLLGAGASMAAGFPAAAGLSKHLDEAHRQLTSLSVSEPMIEKVGEDIEWLRDVQEGMVDVSQQLSGLNLDNIEDIFRIWGHEVKSSTPPPDAPDALIPGYQYPRLIRMLAIALAYSPRFPSVQQFDNSNVYSWLISRLVSSFGDDGKREVVVVTTNYDLILEFAAAKNPAVDLSYTYTEDSGLQHLFGRETTADFTLRYLKLHGSLNWFRDKPRSRVSRHSARSIVESESPLAALAERYETVGRDIEMVPPAILKDVIYRRNWTEAWELAYAAFCRCRTLTVVGYSFSPGDVLVQQMATLGLVRSPFLKSIAIVDPDADSVAATLRGHFREPFSSRVDWLTFNEPFDDQTPAWAPAEIF